MHIIILAVRAQTVECLAVFCVREAGMYSRVPADMWDTLVVVLEPN